MWVIIHNNWDDGNTRTEHIQDAEHLRPLREYLAVHCNKRVPPKKKQSKHDTRAKRRSTPKKQNERQGTTKKKKKDHACPVRQAHTHAHVNCMKTHRCRPLPFPRSHLRGPRGGAGRARSRAAARRLPRTPFSCRLVGRGGPRLGVEARTGSLGRGRRGWMRLRMDAWGFGILNACPLACLRVQGTGRGGYSTWEVVSRYRLVVVGADCLEQSYVAYGRSAGGCFRSCGYNASTACSQVHLVLCPRVLFAETGISCTENLLGCSEAQFDVSYLLITFYTRGPCQLSPGPW